MEYNKYSKIQFKNFPEMKDLNLQIEMVCCDPEKAGPDQSTQKHVLVK